MSKFMSLDWFKGKIENSIDRVIAKLDSVMGEEESSSIDIQKIKLVNDQLTVVLNDGKMYTKTMPLRRTLILYKVQRQFNNWNAL